MHPLYKHIFVPAVAPSLALVGLLWKSLRNPQFELQARGQAAPFISHTHRLLPTLVSKNLHAREKAWLPCTACIVVPVWRNNRMMLLAGALGGASAVGAGAPAQQGGDGGGHRGLLRPHAAHGHPCALHALPGGVLTAPNCWAVPWGILTCLALHARSMGRLG